MGLGIGSPGGGDGGRLASAGRNRIGRRRRQAGGSEDGAGGGVDTDD